MVSKKSTKKKNTLPEPEHAFKIRDYPKKYYIEYPIYSDKLDAYWDNYNLRYYDQGHISKDPRNLITKYVNRGGKDSGVKYHVIQTTSNQLRRARDKAEKKHHFKEIVGAMDLLWGNENTLYTYSHKVDNMKDQLNKSYYLTQRQISEDVIKELKHKARKRGKRFF